MNLSKITPLGTEVRNEVITCNVGDVIKLRVDLFNRYGKARSEGHDSIIAWMVEDGGGKRRAGANVTDLRNGSYEVLFKCLWPGSSSKVNCSLTPRIFYSLDLRLTLEGENTSKGRLIIPNFLNFFAPQVFSGSY